MRALFRLFLFALTALAGVTLVSSAAGRPQAAPSGQVALVEAPGNIVLVDVATGLRTPVTEDAVSGARHYHWPTWSSDGRLAFFATDLLATPPYQLGIFVKPAEDEPVRVYASPDEVFTYAGWAPDDCPGGGCRDLAVLYTTARGDLALRSLRATAAGEVTITELSEGGPHYWDWAPNGQTMFWARYGDRLELFDAAAGDVIRTFDEQQGLQRSVDWSPVDDRLLTTVAAGRRASSLVIFDGDARQVLVEGLRSPVAFEWSPDGTKVAYVDSARGALAILDAETGQTLVEPADRVLAFFWSPDGTRIAYIVITREGESDSVRLVRQTPPVLQWYVTDLATESTLRLASFLPSQDMFYFAQFFDQFAHSHRLWSPDSRYLVYGERLGEGREVVSLLDITRAGSPPETLAEGTLGIFSW